MSSLIVALPLLLACQLVDSQDYNFRIITDVNDISPPNYTTVLPEGYVAFPNIGLAYKFHKRFIPWNIARKLCISESARLAIVDSFQKIEYIMGLKDKNHGVHTGIHRMFENTEWTSIANGQPLKFIPWRPDADIKAGTGQCVAIWNDGIGVGPWECNTVLPTICEMPISCTHIPSRLS